MKRRSISDDAVPTEALSASGRDVQAALFEVERPRLRGLAYRILGSLADADDVVQEAWLRLSRVAADPDRDPVANAPGWLTTVTARLALDALRARKRRGEEALGFESEDRASAVDTQEETILAEQVGLAFLVVLDRLAPAERLAFVLHDVFGLPFEDVAEILGRSPAAARQVASRARRRIRADPVDEAAAVAQRTDRAVIDAFAAAARAGDVAALIRLFDPDVTLHLDPARLPHGAPSAIHGAAAVAGRARLGGMRQAGQMVLVDGRPALAVAPGGRLAMLMTFEVVEDRIVRIEVVSDPKRLRGIAVTLIPDA